jgi:hypothetical protein
MNFTKGKGSKNNIICVIDVNQHENIQIALEKGFDKVIEKTNIKNIEPAKE